MSSQLSILGRCRVCGCTEASPCNVEGEACAWFDFDRTLCTNFRCIGAVPLEELEELTILRRAG